VPTGQDIKGGCLCGAVEVTARVDQPILRACHCEMCRRHTSGAFMSVSTVAGSVEVHGPAQTYRSSDWAERGFCGTCGSTLWYGTVEDGVRNLSAGLFPDAAGGVLKVEFFADLCPGGYGFAGAHRKMSSAETIALFAPNEGSEP